MTNLQDFGVSDLKEASKQFSKRFACSASVVKNASNKEEVQIQGDVTDDLMEMLMSKFSIKEADIEVKEPKRKKAK